MLTLLINLDRDHKRLKKMQDQLALFNMSFQRIQAIDATEIPSQEIQKHRLPVSMRSYWLKEMSDAEICCYLSHLKAWDFFLNSHEEWAFILEDDIEFTIDPTQLLNLVKDIPNDVDVINTSAYSINKKIRYEGTPLNLGNNFKLVKTVDYRKSGGGTQGYLINRKAATLLKSQFHFIYAPVDDMLFFHSSPLREHTGSFFLCPTISVTQDNTGSRIQSSRSKLKTHPLKYPAKYSDRQIKKILHWFKTTFACKSIYR